MQRVSKSYRLNRDFEILCTTDILDDERKYYTVEVLLVSVPFWCAIEEYRGLTEANEANSIYKRMKEKYREDLTYAY